MIPAEVRNRPEHELHIRYTLTTELAQSVGGLFVYSVVGLPRCCLTSTDQNVLGDDGIETRKIKQERLMLSGRQ